jgi:hypothetical protein
MRFRTLTGGEYSSGLAMPVKTVRRASAWALAGICQLAALPLAGDTAPPGKSAAVKGEFAFTGTEQCAYASAFGPPPVLQAMGPVVLHTSTLQGTLTLAPDGTGRLTGRIASLQSLPGAGATPATQSSLTCAVKHALSAKGELRLERTCRGTRSRGTGSEGAQTWTASTVRESGQFSADTIALADTELAVESLTIFGVNLARVCHRISWLTKSK